ncbi:MAG TPA: strawberry notch family protein, partial [Deltaproteobacteria bacterium]|nr:strawberry notch family protein [Deltaproteobacteria bacterium]
MVEEEPDAVFSRYQPKVTVKGAKPHPANLVESAAMAAIDTIQPTYTPNLPQEAIAQGKISDIQLEAVIFAGQAHSEFLPGEDEQGRKVRRGFFIGDGTGVGKGREIAAILWDNWRQGRKKAVWISKNAPLIHDARRDAKGVGWGDHLFDFGKAKMGTSVTNKEGVAFITYDTLKTDKTNEGKGTRLEQLVEWLGEDFDGVIAFDESHGMGNAVSVKGKRGSTDPSKRALAGIDLQRRLPNARIVYVSATGATEVMNLAYAARLGLWGARTAFAKASDFISAIKGAGLSAMELVARDLKAMGLYCARSLTYHDVKYERLEHSLTPQQREVYDELVGAWQIVLDNINQALEITGIVRPNGGRTMNGKAKSSIMAQFWGSNQRFWNQIITSMQMPSVIKGIEADIAAGHSVVLQLVNTNESEQKRALGRMEEDDAIEDLDMTPRQALMNYVQNAFPIYQYHEVKDSNGNVHAEIVKDSQGNNVVNPDAEALRDELLTRLGGVRVPDSPLEMILDAFGVDKVAEVTGRKQRVVIDPKSGKRIVEKRSTEKCTEDANAFNAGKKRILIFSDAGGTGRSFHAGLDVNNQQLRRHYLIQPGWRADNAVQGFGRTHRSNQRQAPEYILVCTDLKGHKRFLSSIARRLDQLGALTKGQRQTASQGFFTATDNLESFEAERALEKLIFDLSRGAVEGLTLHEFEAQTGLVLTKEVGGRLVSAEVSMPQFMNRLLNMKIDMQSKIFDEFAQRHEAAIARAMADGTLDMGMETLRAKRIAVAGEQVVHTDQRTGAETKHIELDLTHDARLLDFDRAGDYAVFGFYRNKTSGRIWAVGDRTSKTNTQTGEVYWSHGAYGVNFNRHDITEKDLNNSEKYERLNPAKAREAWEKEYAAMPKEVTERVHLITGVILPLWDRLKTDHIRIKRAFAGGQSYLGQQLLSAEVKPTLERLGASASKLNLSPEQVFDNIINHKATVTLANGWRMMRKKVSGDQRIELIGPDYAHHDELRRYGVIIERINYETRLFIPTDKAAGTHAIKEITETRPVMSSEVPITAKASSDAFADHLDDDRYRMGKPGGPSTIQAIKDAIAKIRTQ